MRDTYLVLITLLIRFPGKPLKFYVDASSVSRGTFFKVKGHLECMGILSRNELKQFVVDRSKAQGYLDDAYPGLPIKLDALSTSQTGRLNPTPSSDSNSGLTN